MSNKSKIEICANSVESAVKAQQAGAYRVELCAGIPEGGTTPSFGEIRMARQLLNQTKLHVIIRPRGGDFLYSPPAVTDSAAFPIPLRPSVPTSTIKPNTWQVCMAGRAD